MESIHPIVSLLPERCFIMKTTIKDGRIELKLSRNITDEEYFQLKEDFPSLYLDFWKTPKNRNRLIPHKGHIISVLIGDTAKPFTLCSLC